MENSLSNIQTKIGESVGLIEPEPKRDWVKWILVIALLALLGVNIFTYLSKITDWFGGTFGPVVKGTVGTAADVVGDTAKQTISTAAEGTKAVVGGVAEGTKAVVGGVAEGTTTGISELQKALDGDVVRNNIDNRGITNGTNNTSAQAQSQMVIDQDDEEADTSIVGPRTKGLTSGFCYIGEDRGVRSCMAVGHNDKCVSKQIYPTMDVCVNPNLRP